MCNFQTQRFKRLEEKVVNIAEVKNAMDYEKQQYKFVQSLLKYKFYPAYSLASGIVIQSI